MAINLYSNEFPIASWFKMVFLPLPHLRDGECVQSRQVWAFGM